MFRPPLIVAVTLGGLVHASSGAVTIRVDDDAPPGGDGTSWTTAYRFLQDALAEAAVLAGGGATVDVLVAQGSYWPDVDEGAPLGTGDRDATFAIPDGVSVAGGYAGTTEPDPDMRDVAAFETILSGDLAGDDGPGFTGMTENSRHVVTTPGPWTSVTLDGLTIRGGHADGAADDGAGVVASGGELLLRTCTVAANLAQGSGGGLGCPGAATVIIETCVFDGNAAHEYGGGVWTFASTVSLADTTFTGNHALGATAGFGGGAAHFEGGQVTADGCTFVGNDSAAQGGGVHELHADSLFRTCRFEQNTALAGTGAGLGGGYRGDNIGFDSLATFIDCDFIDNHADQGGGIAFRNRSMRVYNCRFLRNTAFHPSGFGGRGGAIFRSGSTNYTASSVVVGCVLSGNQARVGGAVYDMHSVNVDTRYVNCAIVGNRGATNEIGAGAVGGIQDEINGDPGPLVLSNCILWGNTDDTAGNSTFDEQITLVTPADANHDCIQGYDGTQLPGGAGNIGADPLLNDPLGPDGLAGTEDDDLRTVLGSPCIDTGLRDLVPADAADLDGDGDTAEPVPLDPDGHPRLFDYFDQLPNDPAGLPDIGAFELIANCLACPGEVFWIDPAGGAFGDGGNWFPGVPNPFNGIFFDLDSTYTVSYAGIRQVERVTVRSGAVTFDLGGYALDVQGAAVPDAPSVLIGPFAGDDAALTLMNGLVTSTGVTLGRDAGSSGEVVLDAAQWFANGPVVIGNAGAGALDVRNGAFMSMQDVQIGDEPGAFGTWVIEDAGSMAFVLLVVDVRRGVVEVGSEAELDAAVVSVLGGGQLVGDGTVTGLVLNFGDVVVGSATGPGDLVVDGDYEQFSAFGGASGTLTTELFGAGGQNDVLVVNGEAELGGGLFVNAVGFMPAEQDSFQVVSAQSLTGAFDVAFLPFFDDRLMRVQYGAGPGPGAGDVTLTVEPFQDLLDLADPQSLILEGVPASVVLADFDGRMGLDIAVALEGADPLTPGAVAVYLQQADGQFALGDLVGIGRGPTDLAAGLLDDGAVIDLVAVNSLDNSVSLLFGAGDGTFGVAPPLSVGSSPRGVAVADFDGDDREDLAVTSSQDDTVRILHSEGGGGFVPGQAVAVGTTPGLLDPHDLDDDKDVDLVVLNGGGASISVIRNLGGFFAPHVEFAAGPNPTDLDVRDLDNDGFPDVVTSNAGDGTVSVFLSNAGAAALSPAVNLPVGASTASLAAADLDDDGDVDIAVIADAGTPEAQVRILRNDLDGGAQLAFSLDPEPVATPNAILLARGDLDGDAVEDLVTINDDLGGAGPAGPVAGSLSLLYSRRCPADLAGGGDVGFGDLLVILGAWGPCPGCPEDLDGDDAVGFSDLLALLAAWGPCR